MNEDGVLGIGLGVCCFELFPTTGGEMKSVLYLIILYIGCHCCYYSPFQRRHASHTFSHWPLVFSPFFFDPGAISTPSLIELIIIAHAQHPFLICAVPRRAMLIVIELHTA